MKKLGRRYRHKRVRKKISGSGDNPRMVVFRSKKHIYVQLIDDSSDRVVSGLSTLSKDFRQKNIKTTGKNAAREVGKLVARKAAELSIKKVSLDRAGYAYHGRVKDLAEGAREGGLKL